MLAATAVSSRLDHPRSHVAHGHEDWDGSTRPGGEDWGKEAIDLIWPADHEHFHELFADGDEPVKRWRRWHHGWWRRAHISRTDILLTIRVRRTKSLQIAVRPTCALGANTWWWRIVWICRLHTSIRSTCTLNTRGLRATTLRAYASKSNLTTPWASQGDTPVVLPENVDADIVHFLFQRSDFGFRHHARGRLLRWWRQWIVEAKVAERRWRAVMGVTRGTAVMLLHTTSDAREASDLLDRWPTSAFAR